MDAQEKAENTVLREGERGSRGGEIEDFERNKHREASGGNRERKREREVAKIVSILLILPQLAEAEMAEAAVQIITLSCLPGKYLLLSIKEKATCIKGKITKICSSSVERLQFDDGLHCCLCIFQRY